MCSGGIRRPGLEQQRLLGPVPHPVEGAPAYTKAFPHAPLQPEGPGTRSAAAYPDCRRLNLLPGRCRDTPERQRGERGYTLLEQEAHPGFGMAFVFTGWLRGLSSLKESHQECRHLVEIPPRRGGQKIKQQRVLEGQTELCLVG